MRERLYEIIMDALKSAGISYDSDGETIWVDDPETGVVYYGQFLKCEN